MNSRIQVFTSDQLALCDEPGRALLVNGPGTHPRPDAHMVLKDGRGDVAARLSLWWTQVPLHPGHRLGIIGQFTASARKRAGKSSSPTEGNLAVELLSAALAELAAHGCTLAIGPMDGSTWEQYRFITERGTEPAFFLEPDHPAEWPRWFELAGFSPLASYCSSLAVDLSIRDPRVTRVTERLSDCGVAIRPLNPEAFTEELRRIYAVSTISFQSNFLYTPISQQAFLTKYGASRPWTLPALVLIAEQASRPVGFVFGVPDWLQRQRGQCIETAVLKTVAVLPGRSYAGLGNVLVAEFHQAARSLGYRRVIHALMHENNNSLNLSGHYAKPFRRYALFACPTPGNSFVAAASRQGALTAVREKPAEHQP